jgi:adenylate kinase
VECEIFGTLHEEAMDSYPKEIVHQLSSSTPEEMEENVERIIQWIESWKLNNKSQQ